MGSQEVSQLSNVVLEDLNPPKIQYVAQSSNSHSLENIYAAVQEVNSHLKGMERHLLFLQEQYAQTSQTRIDLLSVLTNILLSSS